jgi:predicted secreted protein
MYQWQSRTCVYDDKREKIIGWRERGEIVLEDLYRFAALSTLTGELIIESVTIRRIQPFADSTCNATENELMRSDRTFHYRADIAAKAGPVAVS